jgi:hypothetical protein
MALLRCYSVTLFIALVLSFTARIDGYSIFRLIKLLHCQYAKTIN